MVPTTSPKPMLAGSLKSRRIVDPNSLNISESKNHQFQFFEKKTVKNGWFPGNNYMVLWPVL
jgi:hypothetical protein